MIKKLQRRYALTENGAKGLVRATLWTVAANLSLMVPIGLLIVVLMNIITALSAGGDAANGVWGYTALAAILVAVIYIVHWIQAIVDYILAFGVHCLAGLFKKNIIPGILVGGFGRFFFATLSGWIFFAEYAPEGQAPLL